MQKIGLFRHQRVSPVVLARKRDGFCVAEFLLPRINDLMNQLENSTTKFPRLKNTKASFSVL